MLLVWLTVTFSLRLWQPCYMSYWKIWGIYHNLCITLISLKVSELLILLSFRLWIHIIGGVAVLVMLKMYQFHCFALVLWMTQFAQKKQSPGMNAGSTFNLLRRSKGSSNQQITACLNLVLRFYLTLIIFFLFF